MKNDNENNKLRSKTYYEDNKDRLNEKHECGCGGCYTYKNRTTHEKTKSHTYIYIYIGQKLVSVYIH